MRRPAPAAESAWMVVPPRGAEPSWTVPPAPAGASFRPAGAPARRVEPARADGPARPAPGEELVRLAPLVAAPVRRAGSTRVGERAPEAALARVVGRAREAAPVAPRRC